MMSWHKKRRARRRRRQRIINSFVCLLFWKLDYAELFCCSWVQAINTKWRVRVIICRERKNIEKSLFCFHFIFMTKDQQTMFSFAKYFKKQGILIKEDPQKGRYVVANKDFKVGMDLGLSLQLRILWLLSIHLYRWYNYDRLPICLKNQGWGDRLKMLFLLEAVR